MEKYYRATNARGTAPDVLHTNEECKYLQSANNYRRAFIENHPNAEICSECQGTTKSPKEQDHSLYNRIRKMAEEGEV